MTVRDSILYPLDVIRGIPSLLGIRLYSVSVRVTRWAEGNRIGTGAKSVTDTPLLINGSKNPRVRQLTTDETVSQGNAFEDQLFEIGPMTPPFTTPSAGGINATTVNPATNALDPQEVHYIVTGPGLPANGVICSKVRDSLEKPFRYMLVVKRIGVNK